MANLTQLKMLEDLDGVLLVDKPAGIAFSTVVKTVKRKFNLVKVGHGGSLDASASGLFVLLINGANRFAGDVMGADRAWEGRLRLGVETDTDDAQGRRTREADASHVDDGSLSAALAAFKGDVFQTEPRFCAVRREGSAAYDVVDTGEHRPFLAHVYRFDLSPADGPCRAFSLVATKQLIVRALVGDLGRELGCGATLEALRRTRVGKFSVGDAVAFDRLLETDIGAFASLVKPMSVIKA